MNKNTLTFERKLYVAPACKTHVLQADGSFLVGDDSNPTTRNFNEEDEDIFG